MAHELRKHSVSKLNLNDSFTMNKSEKGGYASKAMTINRVTESQKQLHKKQQNHKVHENAERGVYVEGLSEVVCSDCSEAYACLLRGLLTKRVSQTSRNVHSSRSHTILQIKLYTKPDLAIFDDQLLRLKRTST